MNNRTCAAADCAADIPVASGPGRPRKYCSSRCARKSYRPSPGTRAAQAEWRRRKRESADFRAAEAAHRKSRRERDKLDPTRVLAERERNRAKMRRRSAAALNGWRSLADDLPRQIDAEMDALMKWRYIDCGWCGDRFWTRRIAAVSCSRRCKAAAKRMRRRAAEVGATGTYTWAEVVKIYRQIGRVCTYCHEHVPPSEIEPDHVVALSVGGSNSIHNIAPSCKACNSDKRDLSLDEWSADRARRGLEPRRLHPQISHLTSLMLAA